MWVIFSQWEWIITSFSYQLLYRKNFKILHINRILTHSGHPGKEIYYFRWPNCRAYLILKWGEITARWNLFSTLWHVKILDLEIHTDIGLELCKFKNFLQCNIFCVKEPATFKIKSVGNDRYPARKIWISLHFYFQHYQKIGGKF